MLFWDKTKSRILEKLFLEARFEKRLRIAQSNNMMLTSKKILK